MSIWSTVNLAEMMGGHGPRIYLDGHDVPTWGTHQQVEAATSGLSDLIRVSSDGGYGTPDGVWFLVQPDQARALAALLTQAADITEAMAARHPDEGRITPADTPIGTEERRSDGTIDRWDGHAWCELLRGG